jgi:iron-sulfur cluster insertion protein
MNPTDLAASPVSSTPVSPEPVQVLTVTERALKKIAAERIKRQQPDLRFRVTVSGGGCSGLQYQFGYDDQPLTAEDLAFGSDMVISDEVSLRFLNGATLDYEQDLMGSRFAIKNPNAVSGCGCGVSFSVDFGKL